MPALAGQLHRAVLPLNKLRGHEMQTQANTASKVGDGIEITPEMFAAGVSAISGFELLDAWEGYESRRSPVAVIFRAMAGASSQPFPIRSSLEIYLE
jgi:hypothetical protein